MFLFLIACGSKDADDEAKEVEFSANVALTEPNCQKAIDLLENNGRRPTDASYTQTLASAYACKANFSEVTFFTSDVTKISSSTSSLFNTLATFTTSVETSPDSASYTNLQTAIDILLYAGPVTTSSTVRRETELGTKAGEDVSLQALYMMFAQLGKYLHLYGNADNANGAKGARDTSANNCVFTYTATDVVTALTASAANGCGGTDGITGSSFLAYSTASEQLTTRTRMCQAFVLFTNIYDVLTNVTFSSSSSLGQISDLASSITGLISGVSTAQVNEILGLRDQSSCESFAQGNFDTFQLYFYAIFEANL